MGEDDPTDPLLVTVPGAPGARPGRYLHRGDEPPLYIPASRPATTEPDPVSRLLDLCHALADEQAWILALGRDIAQERCAWTPELRERVGAQLRRLGSLIVRSAEALP